MDVVAHRRVAHDFDRKNPRQLLDPIRDPFPMMLVAATRQLILSDKKVRRTQRLTQER